MRMLAHPYPRVRRFTAEQLYIRIIEDDSFIPTCNDVDSAIELLSSVAWDANAQQAREARNQVADFLGIELSVKDRAPPQKTQKSNVKKDEFQSYASLVQAEGR